MSETASSSAEPGSPAVTALYRYPLKGFSPERLEAVDLSPGETFPGDRAYAIENGPGRFDPDNPKHLPKINFLMLMRNERLASLETRYADATDTLTVLRDGKQVARGQLATKLGRQMIEQFLAAYLKGDLRGPPRIVAAPGHSFSDMDEKCVHLVNLATVREIERSLGKPIDPLRFRANIYFDGAPAFAETHWIDRALSIGPVRLDVFAMTERCAATNVDPVSAARDLAIPQHLMRTYNHSDVGIYARVVAGGRIQDGDRLMMPS
ncbi:MAG: MOSC domain-containing protein [Hyphomicrobiaceae bacterium]